jgi:N-acetylglucosaminyldiphosphoundecaprenol N-acetyl-beta-D-mannosaminyltransferase
MDQAIGATAAQGEQAQGGDLGNEAVRRMDIFGLPLNACRTLQDAVAAIEAKIEAGETVLTTFINPSAVALARKNPGFKDALSRFDFVLPDGIGVVKAAAKLRGVDMARISFDSSSIALPVFETAQRTGRRVVLVGGAPGVAERAAASIREGVPGIEIAAALDGYGDWSEKIEWILALRPEIVICGMGGVAQEKFMLALAEAGWCGCGFTCGGYLDQLGAGLQYYPGWVDRTNLRWAYRLAREPRRLWRRYLVDYQRFVLLFVKSMVAQRIGLPAA